MGAFAYLQDIYQLDTLDTRFTNSATAPYKSARDSVDSASSADATPPIPIKLDTNGKPRAQPSKWGTSEFYFYYFVFITVVPYMFWIPFEVSRPSDPNYHKYEHLLSPGWVPGRKIDVSDAQYSTFRENIPYTALLVLLHPILRRIYDNLRSSAVSGVGAERKSNSTSTSFSSVADGVARLNLRTSFDYYFALGFLIVLHGFSTLKILIILYLNFSITTRLPKKYVPALTWTFNISILFANELCDGYKFATIVQLLSPIGQTDVANLTSLKSWGEWLDNYGGLMSRWDILFNITVLRSISHNMDYYWSLDRRAGSPEELANIDKKKQLNPSHLSDRDRVETPASPEDYCFRNYVAYALYAPLYIAGPVLTFNDYIAQLKYPPPTIEHSRTLKYGIRFLVTLLSMELILHFDYCVAISKADPNWSDYTPAQLSLMSYFNLHIIWLKLLIPWRLFRLWALIDGIDPPENMVRCISNSSSTSGFWRGWHKSYNRWLIRYLYVPLGGSRTQGRFGGARSILNYVLVFTFVALWHDIQLNLLIWGWLIVLFMLPEVLGGYLFPRNRWLGNLTAYRIIRSFGVVLNIMMMMTANLVGFAVGVDGLKSIIGGIFKDYWGIAFLATVSAALFVGIQVMLEIRESEIRRGIEMKC